MKNIYCITVIAFVLITSQFLTFARVKADRSIVVKEKAAGVFPAPKLISNSVTVSGKVVYDSGQPFSNAFVWFENTASSKIFSTRTDNNGNYSAAIDSGVYYIAAYVNYIKNNMLTYRHMYYNNKSSFNDADVVHFGKDTTNINFMFPTLTLCSISGTISDAVSHKPLSNVFIAVNSIENRDSTFIGTDQNGNYTIQVFEGSYTLYAYQPGYFLEYYKDVFNSFDATRVVVNRDSSKATGINFNLTKPDPGSNSISGLVGDPMWLAGVEVYAIPSDGGKWIGAKTGNDGRFFIGNLKNGSYVLLFYMDGYKSQYFGDSLNTINLTGNMNLNNIFVIIEKLNSVGGEITGTISSGSDLPLSGTLLVAVDSLSDTVSTSISDHNGNYSIPSLPNGSYTIIANKIGYDKAVYPQKIDVNLSDNPIVSGINIFIIPTEVNNYIHILPQAFQLYQNYPNPFNPSTTIKYQIPKESLVTIKIFDVLGREVATLLNAEQKAGEHEVIWNASDIASGVYIYQVKAGNFIAAKKMLLIK